LIGPSIKYPKIQADGNILYLHFPILPFVRSSSIYKTYLYKVKRNYNKYIRVSKMAAPQTVAYVTLDVFTKNVFLGNPLGVVFLPTSTTLTQTQKQLIAKEFNYSETIFVHPVDEQNTPTQRRIDIFTIKRELPFAGHPTIGAASWILNFSPDASAQQVNTIITKAGPIPISLKQPAGDEVTALIPHDVKIHQKRFPVEELLRLHSSLEPFFLKGSSPTAEAQMGFPVVSIVKGMAQVHVQLPSLEALAAVTTSAGGEAVADADVSQGGYLDDGWGGHGLVLMYFHVRDVVDEVTGKKVIRTRMLLEAEEDPATGSAASGLVAYLTLEEQAAKGAEAARYHDFHVVQGVEMGRRSDIGLRVALKSDGAGIDSVELSGSSVEVAEGRIRV
jgi:predicted PhzF superfamily epimerase YddE/YHI9